MPTTTYHRRWCKTCEDWELYTEGFGIDNTLTCKSCGVKHEKTLLKEIPKNKLIEQRERYKEMEKKNFGAFGSYLLAIDPFSAGFPQPEIIESSAGQKTIDKAEKKKRDLLYAKKQEKRKQQIEETKKYTQLGRNDICACGSGKKYKKCCLSKIQSIIN